MVFINYYDICIINAISVRIWKSLKCKSTLLFIVTVSLLQFLLCWFVEGSKFEHWIVYINPFIRYFDFLIGGLIYNLSNLLFVNNNFKQSRCYIYLFFWLPFVIFAIVLVLSTIFQNEYFATAIWTIPASVIILSTYMGGENKNYPYVLKLLFKGTYVRNFGNISLAFFMIHQLLIRYLSTIARHVVFVTNQWFVYFCVYAIAFIVSCCFSIVHSNFFTIKGKA